MNPLGTRGQGVGWHPGDAMVASRSVLTLAEGLGSRFHQVMSPRGAARTPAWRAVAVAGAAGDVAKAVRLARDPRFRFAARMALDAADLALWCMAAGDDTDTSEDAVIPGVALAAEAAARWGAGGIVVPAINAGVAAAVRARRGHKLRLEQFSWQLMGSFGGWALRMLAHRRKRLVDRMHDAERAARLQQAELGGLHDLIVEHEGAVDLLQRATALVELSLPAPAAGTARRSFAGAVKAAVAATARGRATYLGDALAGWQAHHNMDPDLAGVVELEVQPGAGTALLSEAQATLLVQRLDAMNLSGPVPVGIGPVESPERGGAQPEPFGPRSITIGGQRLDLPGDRPGTRWVFDATPVAFLMDLGWLAQPTGAHREAVPWSVTAGPMGTALAVGLWSARRYERNRSISPRAAVAVSGAVTLAYTAAATLTMRNPHTDDGVSRFPWVMALQGYELVRGVSGEEMGPRARALGLAGTAAIVGTGWTLSPRPRSARALLAELGWVVAFDAFTARLRRANVESGALLSSAAAAEDQTLAAEAYARGRERALAIVADALGAARRDLESSGHLLDPEVRGEARDRLARVEAMLADAMPAGRAHVGSSPA